MGKQWLWAVQQELEGATGVWREGLRGECGCEQCRSGQVGMCDGEREFAAWCRGADGAEEKQMAAEAERQERARERKEVLQRREQQVQERIQEREAQKRKESLRQEKEVEMRMQSKEVHDGMWMKEWERERRIEAGLSQAGPGGWSKVKGAKKQQQQERRRHRERERVIQKAEVKTSK